MAEISRVTSHANPTSHFTPHSDNNTSAHGRIMGASARRVPAPARLAEKIVEANVHRKRDPSRSLGQRSGIALPTIQPMPRTEVLQRAQTIGTKLRRATQQAVAILRRPKGGAKEGIAALYLALSGLDDEVEEGSGRAPLLDEEFGDSKRFAELVWETEDPEELVDLLKSALPGSELGDPKDLFAKIRGLGRDQSALMDLLAGLQGIPSRIEDRKTLRAVIQDEIQELESGSDTREVSFFRLADLAAKQPDPLAFLSTFVDEVVKKENGVRTWIQLLRSILRGHPSGATSSETFEGTVRNFILSLGVEMREMLKRGVDNTYLGDLNSKLQRIYKVHSFLDRLGELRGEVDRSIELLATS
ncbi:hypothetical protein H6CHR_01867 [Variovorax sp. PBL-H6]|uniref:hypothetical protein n=1 Tax=Variovorax sp. PBL-H6 TaxID=434009 RepID=UPI001318CA57|nr:hypothetical protein [Variovorax sp. PBL-H6]VTU22837.1 hypothetical protein H6CHR_01867 [Variovorax sp. PBL-H6]